MTTPAAILLGLAAAFAVADWVAVARGEKRLEYVAKPAALALLVGVALLLEPADPTQRAWWVAALVCSLAGDVFLMLPGRFVPGLASFLLGHLAYIAGFWLGPVDAVGAAEFAVALGLPLLGVAVLGPRILAGARSHDRRLAVPVGAYFAAINAMVASALLTRQPLAIAGALLFFASDSMIGFRNFVAHRSWHDLAIITTYHVGQGLLVLSLL